MKKVYLLLRNNKETGPFTFSEIMQQSLQPSDLIWIEGESICWRSPSALSVFNLSTKNNKKRHVKENAVPIIANNSFKTALTFAEELMHETSTEGTLYFTNNDLKSQKKAQNELELILHKRGQNTVSFLQLIAAGIATALAILLWNSGFIPVKAENISYAATPVVFNVEPPPPFGNAVEIIAADTVVTQEKKTLPLLPPTKKGSVNKQKSKSPDTIKIIKAAIIEQDSTSAKDKKTTNTSTSDTTKLKESSPQINNAGHSAKKKTLGQTIRTIFKKKKRNAAIIDSSATQ